MAGGLVGEMLMNAFYTFLQGFNVETGPCDDEGIVV